MASIRDIFVRLGVKTDPKKMKEFNRGLNNIKQSALSLGTVLTTGIVAVGIKRMIDTASDLAETANKFGAVFGDAGSDVQQQLDDIRRRTGATNMELQDMASNIGALIKPALGSAEAAGQMATAVTELALDISSFNNVTSEDALIALRSGLIGSAEPLQRFGVDVRVAALELEAMRQGINKSVKDMTEGERVQLRYAAIQRQLGEQGATGDATRTAEGFANASRNLGAAIKETAGIIGTFFLGSVGNLVNETRRLVDGFQEWLAANRALIQQRVDRYLDRTRQFLTNLWNSIARIINAVDGWTDGLGRLGQTLLNVVKTVAVLAAILLLPGGAILLLIDLIALIIDDLETMGKSGDSISGDLVQAFMEIGYEIEMVRDAIKDAGAAIKKWADDNVEAIEVVASAILGVALAFGVAKKAAIASWAMFKLWALKYYAVIWASEAKTTAMRLLGAGKVKSAWTAANAAAAASFIAVAALGALIIWLGTQIYKMLTGQENFFTTMVDGFWNLVESLGGVFPAIQEMISTTWEAWLKFFGMSEDKAKEWADAIAKFITNAIDVATKPLQWMFKGGKFVFEKLGDLGEAAGKFFGGEEGPIARPTATAPAAAGGGNVANTQQQNTFNMEINAPNANAEQVAEMIPPLIAREMDKQNRAAARNFAVAGAT